MSKYLSQPNNHIALYGTTKLIGQQNGEFIYSVVDNYKNICIYCTEEILKCVDGKHYFLVEGKVVEHREVKGQKQTILKDCCFELVDKLSNITGSYYGEIGDTIELYNHPATYRRKYEKEWKITGEFSVLTPCTEYRLILKKDNYTFVIPYDSVHILSPLQNEMYTISGKVVGYAIENGARATFLEPTVVKKRTEPQSRRGWAWWM